LWHEVAVFEADSSIRTQVHAVGGASEIGSVVANIPTVFRPWYELFAAGSFAECPSLTYILRHPSKRALVSEASHRPMSQQAKNIGREKMQRQRKKLRPAANVAGT
jgi:hypothetical protein